MGGHTEDYEETPRWRLLMYPIVGFAGTLALFGVWGAFQ